MGSRDARKGLGLGFGGRRREEMEDTELEEGEAFSYQNNDDYDASIDPDIAYSYLVKLCITCFCGLTKKSSDLLYEFGFGIW